MSLRRFSGWLLASAVVVAMTSVGAHAYAVAGAGADLDAAFGGEFGGGLSRTDDAAHDRFSPASRSDGSRESGAVAPAIELARCPYAKPSPRASARSGGNGTKRSAGGSKSGARKKAAIWNIPSQVEASEQVGGEASSPGGGYYDENGKFHPDGSRP